MGRKSGTSTAARVTPAVSLEEVEKSYGDSVVISCDSLEVLPGEAVVLVGHNGSGKSTLLSMVAGVLDPSSGAIRVHGEPPDSLDSRRRRAWLPDTPVLYDDVSVQEHLQYTARLHGADPDGARIDELLERLGLSERRDDLPSRFSRGLRQKTAIAVALCRPSTVLLVDEPFVGLDAAGRVAFLELLDEARVAGCTLLVATHDPAVVDRFDRALVLDDGRIVHDGAPSELDGLVADPHRSA